MLDVNRLVLLLLQVSVYKAILSHPDAQLIMHKDDPCRCGSDLPQSKCCRKVGAPEK